jgi:hypothetical protein
MPGETKPIAGHLLICNSSPVHTPAYLEISRLWPGLSGSGRFYNGMFGPRDANGHITVLDSRVDFSLDIPARSVGEQIALCLRTFMAGSISVRDPSVVATVQRHFNELVMRWPVLLHPKLIVPVHREGALNFTSVVHALAAAQFGGLPRARHFTGGDQPSDVRERLRRFAAHPCVERSFRQALHAWFDVAGGRKKDGVMRRKTRRLVVPVTLATGRRSISWDP